MRTKPKYKKNKDKALIQHEDKNRNKMRSMPQIQVEEQSLTLKKWPRSKHWQTECRRQRLKENNRTQRFTMQQDKNTMCRQN